MGLGACGIRYGGEWAKPPTPPTPEAAGALDPLLMGCLVEGRPIRTGSEAADAVRRGRRVHFCPFPSTHNGAGAQNAILTTRGKTSIMAAVSPALSHSFLMDPLQVFCRGRD